MYLGTFCYISLSFWMMQRNQNKMSKIQPQMKELRAKHKNDPVKANRQIQKLMKENDVNPAQMFGGCFKFVASTQFCWRDSCRVGWAAAGPNPGEPQSPVSSVPVPLDGTQMRSPAFKKSSFEKSKSSIIPSTS